jgi:hypothetical protein
MRVVLGLLLLTSGCASSHVRYFRPTFLPSAPPVELSSGPPRSACEAQQWLYATPSFVELEPIRIVAQVGETTVWAPSRGTGPYQRGLVVYRGQHELTPMLAKNLIDEEPAVRNDPRLDAFYRRAGWANGLIWAGSGIMFSGLVVGIPSLSRDHLQFHDIIVPTALYAAGLLVTAIGYLVAPENREYENAMLRARVYTPDTDQLDIVTMAVDTANEVTRHDCAATP